LGSDSVSQRSDELVSVRHFEEYTSQYERWYWHTDAEDLLPQVSALIPSIRKKIAQHVGVGRERLLRAGARAALLAGRMAFFDLRSPTDARQYLGLALSLAEEADDPDLLAVILGHCSFIPGWDGDPHAEYLLARAHEPAQKASATTRSWLHAAESEILGLLPGTDERPLHALDQSARLLRKSSVGSPDWIDFFDETRLEGFRAAALLRSGHPEEAKQLLVAVRTALPKSAEKQKIVTLAHESEAAIRLGHIEEACELLRQAAHTLAQTPYETGHERVEYAIELLRNHDAAVVRDFLNEETP
jgi:hypothetical protein